MNIEFKFNKIASRNRKDSTGRIDLISDHEPFKMTINADGNFFYVIFGEYINGGFLCVPNWNIGCDLADFSDIFWNTESIARSNIGEQNAVIIATALAKIKPYVKGGECHAKITEL